MDDKIFGWSYPPGCSGPPDGEEAPYALRCPRCGAFVNQTPTRREIQEEVDEDGETFYAFWREFYTCTKCELETHLVIPVFADGGPDLHTANAKRIFDTENPTPEQRFTAMQAAFRRLYGESR